ncbi:hypothetical protein SVIOM74S_03346 [Streptomyces violarus]
MPLPPSALSGAYARLAEVLPGLAITELTAGDEAPRGGNWTTAAALAEAGPGLDAFLILGRRPDPPGLRPAGTPRRDRQLRPAPLRLAGLPPDHRPLVPAPPRAPLPRDARLVRPHGARPPRRPPGRPPGRVRLPARRRGRRAARRPGRPGRGGTAGRGAVGGRRAHGAGPGRFWPQDAAPRPGPVGYGDGRDRRGALVRRPAARRDRGAACDARAGAAPAGRDQAVRGHGGLPRADRPRRRAAAHPGPRELLHVYTLRPEDTCATCPRTCDADRVNKLLATAG